MLSLSADDIRFFKREGYLVKRGVLNPVLMERAREAMWAAAPPELDRGDPDTWIGPLPKRSDEHRNYTSGYYWKFRQIGTEDWMVRLLATDPSLWSAAESLLGKGTLQRPERVRGLYCNLPEGDAPDSPRTCHLDGHPFHLGVVGYIDRVPPLGGGFKVWAGSHRRFYYDYHCRYGNRPTANLEEDLAYYNRRPCVEIDGEAGDVVFWHHRLGHGSGHNRSRRIRQAVFHDYLKKDLDEKVEAPLPEDMWEDWSEEVRTAEAY